jgi:hypothetical protein
MPGGEEETPETDARRRTGGGGETLETEAQRRRRNPRE